ncbi:AAA family ATPase [Microbacterium sp. zg-YB36]|uniref:AAA family ATPase n=1 Tax=Microbacterium sp. zg-YB36 TaxID=2969407 RepID=UPI00214C14F8|nr:AAA family ATPase [Microbacterium sp. zg-YB36]MDL5350557.1 AAA family ATPase [Microbacterium sp. zg-YB36]
MSATFTADWLMRQEFPPVKYVVPGVIPEGMTLLVAAPKIGKSWMVLGSAIALSEGSDALGCIPVGEPRPVLYLALEDGPRRLQDRMMKLGAFAASPLLEFRTAMGEAAVTETIAAFMTAHAGADPVVILDTLGKVMPPAGNASQYGHDYRVLSMLKGTADAVPGSSLVIVHHTRKSDGGDFLDAVSGTQGIAGAADTVLVLKRERHELSGTLQVTSRDAAEGEYALSMVDGAWTLDGADLTSAAQSAQTMKQTQGVGDRMADVIEAVSRRPEGVTPKDLRALLPDVSNVDEYLRRAVTAGRLAKLTRGLYAPVSFVSSVSSPAPEPTETHASHTNHRGVLGVGNWPDPGCCSHGITVDARCTKCGGKAVAA